MRNNYQKWYLSVLVMILLAGQIQSQQQIEVDNNDPFTPLNLITNVFLGDGVEVTNVTYEGPPLSVAYFKDGEDQVGLGRGVVMTTGVAVTDGTDYGVNAPGVQGASVNNGSNLSDSDLGQIAGSNAVNNVVRYTITFIPVSDTIRFRYTFASEEYPEYVCGDYNDIFGFFISGPGINGPYANNAANIALIPGTDRPVTINNINPGVSGTAATTNPDNCSGTNGSLDFSQYYNSNSGSTNFPVYDGITDVFTAQAEVIPCEEYTIKLVIADIGDSRLDSGVFLEAKSFGTGTVQAETTAVTIDGAIAEGCQVGSLTFTIPDPLEEDLELDYIIGGTAENGRDYELIPDNLVMPAGDTVLAIPVQAIEDGITESRETITFDVKISQCTRKTYTIYVDDAKLLPPTNLETDVDLCNGESTQLQGNSPVNSDPPPFFRSTEEISTPGTFSLWMGTRTSEIDVSGVFPDKLGPGVIRSVCIENFEHRWLDDMDFYLIGPDGQYLELTTDNGGDGGNGNGFDYYRNTCFTPTATQRINAPGPVAPPSAIPFTGDWLPEGNWEDFWDGDKNTNGTYQLLFRDDSFGNAGTLFSWSITFESIYGITYEWSPAAGLSCTDCPNPVVQPTTSTDYTFIIRDSYGCEIENTVAVSVPDESSRPGLTCQTVTGSSVTVAWAAVPDYDTYEVSIDGGNWIPVGNLTQYTVDNLGFSQTVDFQVRAIGVDCPGLPASISCTTPDCPTPTASLSTTDATCAALADGLAQFTIQTGDAPFSFEMMGQTNTTGTFSGLAPGQYSVLVYDANDCPAIYGFTIDALDEIELVLTVDQEVSCGVNNDGRVIASATGGGGNYSYTWSDGQTTGTASGLSAGLYRVSVTSAVGCMQVAEVMLEPPTDMEVSLVTTETRCGVPENGTATLSITDGVPPHTIAWAHDGAETGMNLSGLAAGIYQVTVTDAAGCSLIRSAEVMEAEGINLVLDSVSVSCVGGSDGQLSVTATGGEGPYSYAWSLGGLLNNANVSDLSAGNYSVTVSDAFGCSATASITLTELPPITIDREFTAALCAGNNTGFIELKVTGGTGPYQYAWNTGASTEDLQNLSAGNYTITVTDVNGCTATDAMTIAEAQPIQASVSVDEVFCNGESTGAVMVMPTSGLAPYEYNWSNGATTTDLIDVPAGAYTLTITDASRCQNEFTAIVDQPEALVANLAIEDISCAGGQDGRIGVTATGGVPAYSYSLNGGEFKAGTSFIGLTAADYQVQVRDGNGCLTNQLPARIIEPDPLVVDLGENINVEYGDTLALDSFLITGGTGSQFGYTWTPADSSMLSCTQCLNPTVIVKEQTSFKLLVRDENGCIADDIITIFVNKNNPVMVPTGFTPNGDGSNDLLHVHGKQNGTTVRVFRIFDRWGELLYEDFSFGLNDRNRGWDGTFRGEPMNGGVYMWQIEVEYPDGMRRVLSGSTTLIR